MGLSTGALDALGRLEAGAKMNCIHTVARELIEAGLAFDGWGSLEITEEGRRVARKSGRRRFFIDDPNVANLDPDFTLAPVAPSQPVPSFCAGTQDDVIEDDLHAGRPILWSRERAMRAAGEANGKTGIWVDDRWVAAFMDAYERI